MAVEFDLNIRNKILTLEIKGEWDEEERPPRLYKATMDVANTFKAQGLIVINGVKGDITLMEAREVGSMSSMAPSLVGVAYVPTDFPDKSRVPKFTIAKTVSSLLNAPFQVFYDEAEAKRWIVDRISKTETLEYID